MKLFNPVQVSVPANGKMVNILKWSLSKTSKTYMCLPFNQNSCCSGTMQSIPFIFPLKRKTKCAAAWLLVLKGEFRLILENHKAVIFHPIKALSYKSNGSIGGSGCVVFT